MEIKNLELKNGKTQWSFYYKGSPFITIKKEQFLLFFNDKFRTVFTKMIKEAKTLKDVLNREDERAMQLEKVYTAAKKKKYRNRNMKNYSIKSKEFKCFKQALEIIDNFETNYKDFIASQVEGLKFAGTFPSPNQLITPKAEDRLVKYLEENGKLKIGGEAQVKRIELSYDDKNTDMMSNPKFVAAYNKVEQATATLSEAYYVNDVILFKKGRPSKKVKEYIERLEEKNG